MSFSLRSARSAYLIVVLLAVLAGQAVADDVDRVLVLHSYGLDFKWTLDLDRAVREVLDAETPGPVTVHSETLDAKYHSGVTYMDAAVRFLAQKYEQWSFDVVIVTDNFALEFARAGRDRLWPDVPLVFAGINNYTPELVADLAPATGVAEGLSVARTVDTIRELFPRRRRLFILSDRTATSDQNVEIARRALRDYPLEVVVHEPTTVQSLSRLSTKVGRGDVALLVGLVRDDSMTPLDFGRSGRLVSTALDAPVFSLWDFYMDTGIAGGYMTSGGEQGRRAAELTARILEGTPVENLPVVEKSPNLPIFDLGVLAEYGITEADLPPASVVHNEPLGLWEQYRVEILITISAFLLLLVIALLGYEIARRRGATARATAASLEEKETLLREIHHRVKNNLQVVSSMLSIQSTLIDDEKSLEYFQDARTRIQSMALVHEHLYESPSLARIDIDEYVRELAATVVRSMDVSNGGVRVRTNIAAIGIDLDHAIPLGMVINELLSNAMKYAYPDGAGDVHISFGYSEGIGHLAVTDNGVGMSAEEVEGRGSLGLQLVDALSRQLQGQVQFTDNAPGLRVTFDFPLPEAPG